MFNSIDYKNSIVSALYRENLIDDTLFIKCNPVISDLPYDLRSGSIDELMERMDSIDSEINRRNDILDKAEYRLGVKSRDVERLSKRLDKHDAKREKAIDNINGESDKIVKGIEKLEKKIKKLDWSGNEDLKKTLTTRLDNFKKAHNNFFDKDINPNNLTTSRNNVDRLEANGVSLHNFLTDLYNGAWITKSDLNNGDVSKNIARINKNIDNYEKANKDMSKDSQRMLDDFNDMDYIKRQSQTVVREVDALGDEYDRTLQVYLDKGGDRSVKPGFNQSGHGSAIPDFIDEMNKLQKELGKKYPYEFT